MAIVTAAEFANLCGKSNTWMSKQIAAGLPTLYTGENGEAHQINTATAINWLRKRGTGEQTQTARLRKAQADRVERENQIATGALMTVDEHTDFVCGLANQFVRSLSGLPGRLASELAAIPDPALVRNRLAREVEEIRNRIATMCGEAADRIEEACEQRSINKGTSV